MDARTAAWIRPRSDFEAARDEVEPHRNLTPEKRLAIAAELSRMALAMLDRHPLAERRRLLQLRDEMAPAHEAAWLRLVRRAHGG